MRQTPNSCFDRIRSVEILLRRVLFKNKMENHRSHSFLIVRSYMRQNKLAGRFRVAGDALHFHVAGQACQNGGMIVEKFADVWAVVAHGDQRDSTCGADRSLPSIALLNAIQVAPADIARTVEGRHDTLQQFEGFHDFCVWRRLGKVGVGVGGSGEAGGECC